jgi:hypothetical protein
VTTLQAGGEEIIFNSTFHTKVEAKLQRLSQKKRKNNFKSVTPTKTMTKPPTQQRNK